MNIIIDYGVGNLKSLITAFQEIGVEVTVSGDTEVIKSAKRLILPGVGAFAAAMNELKSRGLDHILRERAAEGTPILGICLGMQLMFEASEENGYYEGLGLIEGTVRQIPPTVKVPHMGWNALTFQQQDPVLSQNEAGDYVYYVHSYYVDTPSEFVIASSNYGVTVPGIVRKSNLVGMQFHPEKSGEVGLNLLKAYEGVK
ncbi:MAG: imidazole glycerol phosphate synthase subunit HisH [Turicibacter sp.]|nr:imidazole glycerol phosphate synthase subunit HisH [Turicibacter sp.]